MLTFEELYLKLLQEDAGRISGELFSREEEFDPYHLECLLNPKKHPLVIKTGRCECSEDEAESCVEGCPFQALSREEGEVSVDEEKCMGCSKCIVDCGPEKLKGSRDIIPTLRALGEHKQVAYALIAPAFLGQFSPEVTPGKLRSAFKALGFDGMVEVALFADILTLKEALEFNENIREEQDYQLASSCCPMWIALIRKVYNELMPHVPCAVSPMIACGRAIKQLYPDALTVFVGPCLAKKAEARESDLAGAVDFVLTFQEVQDVFDCYGINPAELEDAARDHSSRTGRIYAHTGGVSEAVESTLKRINPHPGMRIKTQQANGIFECKKMLADLTAGKTDANFFEGMGCVGGCVGGPKAIIPKEQGREHVRRYGASAAYPTPMENPYVIELLNRLGLPTVESLIEDSDIFTRSFL